MRRSLWLFPFMTGLVWVATVAYPLIASAQRFAQLERSEVVARNVFELYIVSASWSLAVALGAVLIGWGPGRWLGRASGKRGYVFLATMMLAPICLPAYVIFYAWWQAWPADSSLHRWAVEGGPDRVRLLKDVTLYLGLLCWSWPLVAWCVSGSVATTPASREERLLVDGAGPWARLADRFRCDKGGLAIGGLVVFLMTFNNTTCFDLAEIFTFGNELRAIEALGGNPRDTLATGAGAVGVSLLGAILIWWLLARSVDPPAMKVRPIGWTTKSLTMLIWLLAVGLPVGVLLMNLLGFFNERMLREFMRFYQGDMMTSILLAAGSATEAALVALGFMVIWQSHRRWIRQLGHGIALSWFLTALAPGTLVGVTLEAAYNQPAPIIESAK